MSVTALYSQDINRFSLGTLDFVRRPPPISELGNPEFLKPSTFCCLDFSLINEQLSAMLSMPFLQHDHVRYPPSISSYIPVANHTKQPRRRNESRWAILYVQFCCGRNESMLCSLSAMLCIRSFKMIMNIYWTLVSMWLRCPRLRRFCFIVCVNIKKNNFEKFSKR